MAIAHDMVTRNLMADTVCDLLDGGAVIVFKTGADLIMAQMSLDADAFAAAVNGEAIANGFPKSTAATIQGKVEKFEIRDASSTPKIFGTVTLPGNNGDIELVKVDYLVSDPLELVSLNYRIPH